MTQVKELKDTEELKSLKGLSVIHLHAPWSPQCEQMNEVINQLAKDLNYSNVTFCKVEAEKSPQFCINHKVVAVPTFLFMKEGKVLDRVDGAHAPQLTRKLQELSSSQTPSVVEVEEKQPLEERLKILLNSAPVILFMKGNPDQPKCGFSKKIVALLQDQGVIFNTFDILNDPEVRQGLKEYSNWPTYPQLYAKGELIGGLDIVQELIENDEFKDQLPATALSLDERLKELINKSKIMLFMKGDRTQPRCGFSKTTIGILNETGLEYETFDILGDNQVRQGLKEFSKWPTYPQLYVNGELVGGLDIIKELEDDGSLLETLKG